MGKIHYVLVVVEFLALGFLLADLLKYFIGVAFILYQLRVNVVKDSQEDVDTS